jgi:hypothetical protein
VSAWAVGATPASTRAECHGRGCRRAQKERRLGGAAACHPDGGPHLCEGAVGRVADELRSGQAIVDHGGGGRIAGAHPVEEQGATVPRSKAGLVGGAAHSSHGEKTTEEKGISKLEGTMTGGPHMSATSSHIHLPSNETENQNKPIAINQA